MDKQPTVTLDAKDPLTMIAYMEANGMHDEARTLEEKLVQQNPAMASKILSYKTEIWLKDYLDPENPRVNNIFHDIRILCRGQISDPVLLCGETGTGKEILANALHGNRSGKFIAVNCTSLPAELIESELFGHKKGAFTGAIEDRVGKIQAAHAGTLFLDEIGDMPEVMQAKLLRVLQDKKIVRLGDNTEVEVKFRLVCATHRDLGKMVREGKFREDLYYRLAVFKVATIPLRDRPEDIPAIVRKYNKDGGFPLDVDGLLKDTDGLRGNVRELQAIIRRWELLRRMK